MKGFFDFINKNDAPKYDLLKTAIAHHRFAWIHPFDNGNGRTVRLLTYAMLVKQGFNVHRGRILNPTAVFCSNGNRYYQTLEKADQGTREGTLNWCHYVLQGLKKEIEKIDNLLDYKYLLKRILLPAIDFSFDRKVITDIEAKILRIAAEKQVIKAPDVKHLFPQKSAPEISRILKRLKTKKLIRPTHENGRMYVMRFDNNYIMRGVIDALRENGFVPIKD